MVKSGTDFRNMSTVTLTKTETGFDVDVKQVDLDSTVSQDPKLKAEVDKHVGNVIFSYFSTLLQ